MLIYLAGQNGKFKILNSLTHSLTHSLTSSSNYPTKNGNKANWNENLLSRGTSDKERKMDIFLATALSERRVNRNNMNWQGINILESFYSLQKNTLFRKLYRQAEGLNFLLDSGAFTFLAQKKVELNWDSYIEAYGNFINEYSLDLFFELDIYKLIGVKATERLREMLMEITGKKPIPVWHPYLPLSYFDSLLTKFPYVSLGGIVHKEVPTEKYEKAFPVFIRKAHSAGCKIHALGYTRLGNLRKFHFDSVDSTAWLYGNRSGSIYRFNPLHPNLMTKYDIPENSRLKSEDAAYHNFLEWIKLCNFAKTNL